MNESGISRSLAEFAERIAFDEVPGDVRDRAHRVLADAAAAAGGGEAVPVARSEAEWTPHARSSLREQVIELVREIWLASNVGMGACTFLPQTSVAPVVAVMANERGRSSEEILVSTVVGCEFGVRIERALTREPASRWAVGSIASRIAAAVAAMRVLEGSTSEHLSAIGLAATQAGGTICSLSTPTGAWLASRSAEDGLVAALLAKGSWHGPERPLEGDRGLFFLLTGDEVPESLTRGLGTEWLMRSLPKPDLPFLPIGELVRQLIAVFNVVAGPMREEA